MKIIADENIPFVRQAFSHLGEVKTLPGRLITNKDLTQTDVLLVRSVTSVNQGLLENTQIKFVATATSGINHIDTGYLKSQGIGFASALGSNATSVAQYVVSAICYWSILNHRPLNEVSIGIIGYGNVGCRLKSLCDQLNIKTVLNDPPLAKMQKDPEKFSLINQALACDIVSLHVPFTSKGHYPTNNLINKQALSQLNPDGLFINTSRGEVVDEQELLTYSSKNNISLILDVWQNEPKINLNSLAQTLIGTPHIAGYSYDGKIRGTRMIYQACCQHFNQCITWSIAEINSDKDAIEPLTFNQNTITPQNLLNAYPIENDSQKLKQLLTSDLNSIQIDDYFDSLRRNYPIRREWCIKS